MNGKNNGVEIVLFNVGQQTFGMYLHDVIEIFEVTHELGHRFLYRDKELDVIFLSVLFNIPSQYDEDVQKKRQNVIVIKVSDIEKAVIVDNILEIKTLNRRDIKKLPKLIRDNVELPCFVGVVVYDNEKLGIILDLNRIM
jgi:chemotaxis signal transduction protein